MIHVREGLLAGVELGLIENSLTELKEDLKEIEEHVKTCGCLQGWKNRAEAMAMIAALEAREHQIWRTIPAPEYLN